MLETVVTFAAWDCFTCDKSLISPNSVSLSVVLSRMICHCSSARADVIISHQHSLLTHIRESLDHMSFHLLTHDCIHLSNDRSSLLNGGQETSKPVCLREGGRLHHSSFNSFYSKCNTSRFNVNAIVLHNSCCTVYIALCRFMCLT